LTVTIHRQPDTRTALETPLQIVPDIVSFANSVRPSFSRAASREVPLGNGGMRLRLPSHKVTMAWKRPSESVMMVPVGLRPPWRFFVSLQSCVIGKVTFLGHSPGCWRTAGALNFRPFLSAFSSFGRPPLTMIPCSLVMDRSPMRSNSDAERHPSMACTASSNLTSFTLVDSVSQTMSFQRS